MIRHKTPHEIFVHARIARKQRARADKRVQFAALGRAETVRLSGLTDEERVFEARLAEREAARARARAVVKKHSWRASRRTH